MPEDPLQQWQDWNLPFREKPQVLRRLHGGYTNRSYLIKADQSLYVLRFNADKHNISGVDRQRERDILDAAGTAGLAPAVVYCSIEQNILISEFIDGQHWPICTLHDPDKLSRLLNTLQHIHTLDVSTTAFDYRQHAENYWQQLQAGKITVPDELCQQREKILPLLAAIPASTVICHHDPNPKNIITRADRLYCLDWEYAAPGWPAFDYAALSVEWNIPVKKLALTEEINIDDVEKAVELYIYLCKLWQYLNKKVPE